MIPITTSVSRVRPTDTLDTSGETLLRRVEHIHRDRAPRQVITASHFKVAGDLSLIDSLPLRRRGSAEVELHYFQHGGPVSDLELVCDFASCRLLPDLQAQLADNTADPEFSRIYPNGMHWQDGQKRWCFVAFYWLGDKRWVTIDRHNDDQNWLKLFWFGGVDMTTFKMTLLIRPLAFFRLFVR